MNTVVPWAEKLNYKAATVAEMIGVSRPYVAQLEEKSQIRRRKMSNSPSLLFNVQDVFRLARYRRDQGTVSALGGQVIIAVYLPKGGVGKTTTSCEIAFQYALQGYRVLLIDLDGQGDLSEGLGYDPELTNESAEQYGVPPGLVVNYTVADLFDFPRVSAAVPAEDVIKKPYGEAGPHFIPADDGLYDLEEALSIKPVREKQISNFLRDARNGKLSNFDTSQYDFIILDCPPGVGTLATNAIVAADVVVSPISLTRYAVKGISRFARRLYKLQQDFSISPQVVTIPTFYEANFSRVIDNINALRSHFAQSTTEAVIPKSETFSTALDANIPLSLDKPRTPGAAGYRDATKEILSKIMARMGQGALELEGSQQ